MALRRTHTLVGSTSALVTAAISTARPIAMSSAPYAISFMKAQRAPGHVHDVTAAYDPMHKQSSSTKVSRLEIIVLLVFFIV
jgi:hypothetical protein